MKNTIIIIIAILALTGGVWWSKTLSSKNQTILAANGIHWHSELEIYVKGEKLKIPQGVGLGAVHQPMHTHDDAPAIHMEFPGRVTDNDVKLGNFFRIWGKNFREFGEKVTMTVNDKSNAELENYAMKDGDKIVLRYE